MDFSGGTPCNSLDSSGKSIPEYPGYAFFRCSVEGCGGNGEFEINLNENVCKDHLKCDTCEINLLGLDWHRVGCGKLYRVRCDVCRCMQMLEKAKKKQKYAVELRETFVYRG